MILERVGDVHKLIVRSTEKKPRNEFVRSAREMSGSWFVSIPDETCRRKSSRSCEGLGREGYREGEPERFTGFQKKC